MDDFIHCYSRAEALADGVLIDASSMAREAGILYPVALTSATWAKYVAVPPDLRDQDESGRLWDVLWMLRYGISQAKDVSQLRFTVLVKNDNRPPTPVLLKAICGPGDNLEPVITVLLPNED